MRNLTNCLVGGVLAALFLGQILFLLNPQVPLDVRCGTGVAFPLVLVYGVGMGLAYWILLLIFEEVRSQPVRPAWLSFRLLTWLVVLDLSAAAVLAWHNLFYYRLYLPSAGTRSMAASATLLSGAAGVLLVLGLFHYSFGRRAARLGYALLIVVTLGSLALPLWFRPVMTEPVRSVPRLPLRDTPSRRHVTILGFESVSMSYILPAIADGRLPHFARLIENGASGTARTLYPTESLAIWTSVATGKLPRQHGLYSFYRYRFPGVARPFSLLPHGAHLRGLERVRLIRRGAMSSSLRRTHPFWSILSRFGVRMGLVRWWGTYPAEDIDGFVVSELFHRQVRERFEPELPDLTHPRSLFDELEDRVVSPDAMDADQLARFVDAGIGLAGDELDRENEIRRAMADDATYHRIGRYLRERYDPQVFAIYFFGLDTLGHTFFRYHRPESFGDVSDAEIAKYGRVIDAYYDYLDGILGEYVQSRRPDEIFLIVSGHGMEPLPLPRRILEGIKGNTRLSGYHENGPAGMIVLNGPGIARGVQLHEASVLDVTPTLLYLMGLPLGQDMEGKLLAGGLEDTVIRSQPVTFISSYHNFLIEPRKEEWSGSHESPLDALPDRPD